jgi:hypothetical protein
MQAEADDLLLYDLTTARVTAQQERLKIWVRECYLNTLGSTRDVLISRSTPDWYGRLKRQLTNLFIVTCYECGSSRTIMTSFV